MGIPVWVRRSDTVQTVNRTDGAATLIPAAQFAQCRVVIVGDNEGHNETAQRLLKAMLYAINVQWSQIIQIDDDSAMTLIDELIGHKPLFILGLDNAQKLFETPVAFGENKLKQATVPVIITYSLQELLLDHSRKAKALHHLKLLRKWCNNK